MNRELTIETGKRILGNFNLRSFQASIAATKKLIAAYDGQQNEFYKAMKKVNPKGLLALDDYKSILELFITSVENDLSDNISFTRSLKLDTVNEYLKQAELILSKKNFHPAAAVVLIGASLEEFLRNWASDENLATPSKPSIDTYALVLKDSDFISKQDHKEILVWGGLRNDAAHGYWDKVQNKENISLMLMGVNLFIKKYSK